MTNPASAPAVFYQPALGVGIGHLLMALAGHGGRALAHGARFHTTLAHSPLDTPGSAPGARTYPLFDRFLAPCATGGIAHGHAGFVAALDRARASTDPRRACLVCRPERHAVLKRDFPELTEAITVDPLSDWPARVLAPPGAYDLVLIDSVLPPMNAQGHMTASLPLRVAPDFAARVAHRLGTRDYLALHMRHGNGESLGNRVTDEHPDWDGILATLARTARAVARDRGLTDIVVLSDNLRTAERLAADTGGRIAGSDHLPDKRFQTFLREDASLAEARQDRALFDLAALAGARALVAGSSLFARAAGLLSGGAPLHILRTRRP